MAALVLVLSVGAAHGASAQTDETFYVGTDQHVHHFFAVPGSQWAQEDLNAVTGGVSVASGSSLSSFEDVLNNIQNVFYIGTDQHVHQFFAVPGHAWAQSDINAATGALPAASGSSLSSFEDVLNNIQNIFYIGTDQHVHQFFAVPGNSWAQYDINAATGAVAAAIGSSLSSFEDVLNDIQNVFYIGVDQHVHQFFAAPGHAWAQSDINAVTGAVPAAAGSSLSSFEDVLNNIQNIFYIGTDQHVHQFFAVPGNSWAQSDVSLATGAALAWAGGGLSSWPTQDKLIAVTGQVLTSGGGDQGVTISVAGASPSGTHVSRATVTDAAGSYSIWVPLGGSYAVTASLTGYSFSPTVANFSHVITNVIGNFTVSNFSSATPGREYIYFRDKPVAIEYLHQ